MFTAYGRVPVKVDDGQMDGDGQLSWADGSANSPAEQLRVTVPGKEPWRKFALVTASAGTMMSGSRVAVRLPALVDQAVTTEADLTGGHLLRLAQSAASTTTCARRPQPWESS